MLGLFLLFRLVALTRRLRRLSRPQGANEVVGRSFIRSVGFAPVGPQVVKV